MRWKTVVPACAGLGLVAVLVVPAWRSTPPAFTPAALPATLPAPASSANGKAAGPAWLSDLGAPPAPLPVPAEPLAQRIERLVASGDPRDAYRAWWLLHACVVFGRTGHLPERDGTEPDTIADPAHACATVNERMKMARIDYLERAARAGVDGALAELVEEGPFGDPTALTTRPDDPLMVKLDGVPEQQAIPFNGPFLDEIGTGLTPDQKARAQAHADAIVARAADQRVIAKQISINEKK